MALIDRTAAEGVLQDQNINDILQESVKGSAALQSFRTVPMGTKVAQMPILTALPQAQWLTGDTDNKPTSSVSWEKKQLTAEELAVIVPIPENVFDDTTISMWDNVRPLVGAALARKLDQAVFFGTNAPASFDDSLFEGADAAGQVVIAGSSPAGDLADDINETWGIVEDLGLDVNVQYTHRGLRRRLRGLRDDNGQPIYLERLSTDGTTRELFGEDLFYVQNGAWDRDTADAIVGDRNLAILGIRQDVQYKILTEATLTDGAGNVTYSLAEQDMIALRAKFRMGFVVGDVYTVEADARVWPFAALAAAS